MVKPTRHERSLRCIFNDLVSLRIYLCFFNETASRSGCTAINSTIGEYEIILFATVMNYHFHWSTNALNCTKLKG